MAKEGFLDRIGRTKLGSVFIETETEGVQNDPGIVEAASSQPARFQSTPVAVATVPSFRTVITAPSVDPVIKEKIEQIARGTDQISYTKFAELLAGMKADFPGDENAAFKAALRAAKTFGYPVNEILRGLDAILNQLNKAEEQFRTAVPARISAKVGARKQKIAELQQAGENTRGSIANVQAELTRLQAQVTQIESALQNETVLISQDEQTIKDDEAKFVAAMTEVKSTYAAERQKLELYGKGV